MEEKKLELDFDKFLL